MNNLLPIEHERMEKIIKLLQKNKDLIFSRNSVTIEINIKDSSVKAKVTNFLDSER